MDKEQAAEHIAEEKKNSRSKGKEARAKPNERSKNYARMCATANETAEEKGIWCTKQRLGAYKNRFEEMKSTIRECILGRESNTEQSREERD